MRRSRLLLVCAWALFVVVGVTEAARRDNYAGEVLLVAQGVDVLSFEPNAFTPLPNRLFAPKYAAGYDAIALCYDAPHNVFWQLMLYVPSNVSYVYAYALDYSSVPFFLKSYGGYSSGSIQSSNLLDAVVICMDIAPEPKCYWTLNITEGFLTNATTFPSAEVVPFPSIATTRLNFYDDIGSSTVYVASSNETGAFGWSHVENASSADGNFVPIEQSKAPQSLYQISGAWNIIYEPVKDVYYQIINASYCEYRRAWLSINASCLSVALPTIPGDVRLDAAAIYGNPDDPMRTTMFLAYGNDLYRCYIYARVGQVPSNQNNNCTLISTFSIPVKALLWMPPEDQPIAATPPSSDTTADFGATPSFTITSPPQQDFSKAEVTTPSYGNFTLANGLQVIKPANWLKYQSILSGGSGMTLDNFTVNAINYNNSVENSTDTYSYLYTAPLNKNITLKISNLYNPSADLNVTSSNDLPAVTLSAGAVKFTLIISGTSVDKDLFDSNKSATLRWNTCFSNNQQFGRFDIGKMITQTTAAGTVYTFPRKAIGDLVISIPSIALLDNNAATVTHNLKPAPFIDSAGVLQVCIEWEFPYFASQLIYDPDLSALVDTNARSSDNADGDETLVIEIAVPVSIGGAFIVCCACIIFFSVCIFATTAYRRHKRQQFLNQVNNDAI